MADVQKCAQCETFHMGGPCPEKKPRVRKDWHSYFMDIAQVVATRATCDRKHVGAVLVKDRQIIATGYNGSIPGTEHCDDAGHLMEHDHCVRTVHAEVNAVAQAAREGHATKGTTLYCNTFPCWPCFKVIASAGVRAIIYDHKYRMDPKVEEFAKKAGIHLFCLEDQERDMAVLRDVNGTGVLVE